jgi:hypothetical protein
MNARGSDQHQLVLDSGVIWNRSCLSLLLVE